MISRMKCLSERLPDCPRGIRAPGGFLKKTKWEDFMTVVTDKNRNEWWLPREPKCSVCGTDWLPLPFVFWSCIGTEDGLIFCGGCCTHLRGGLTRDFIEVKAIREIQDLGYTGFARLKG
jgi:hypothetical protein